MQQIYLDNASTTRPGVAVIDAVTKTLGNVWGNPSNIYALGREAKAVINEAKMAIAHIINCDPWEIYFTSGASEGNSWVQHLGQPLNVLTFCSPYEHHNYVDAKSLAVPTNDEQVKQIASDCASVDKPLIYSHMLVDNITGRIFDVAPLFKELKQKNPKSIIACDCTQAFGNMVVDVKEIGCDIAIFSGHKFHAPKGIGFVYISNSVRGRVTPLIFGTQQYGMRGGTENVPYIAGIKTAAVIYGDPHTISVKERNSAELWKAFRAILDENGVKYVMNRPAEFNHIASTVSFSLGNHVSSEVIQSMLSDKGIYIGTGSGCNGADEKDYIIQEILKKENRSEEYERGTIRLSFDLTTTVQDIEEAARQLCEVYKALA